MIGDDEKWTVLKDGFIAVLATRSGDQQHRRKGAITLWNRQGPGEFYARSLVRVRDLFRPVGEGRFWLLGAEDLADLLLRPW